MQHLFANIQQPHSFEKKKETERDYWIEEIWKEVRIQLPNISYEKVFWRINNNVKPCTTGAVRDLYFRLQHERSDPRSPYKNFAHAFFARTKC